MKVSRSALLPYSAEQIYDVIADVRSYPGFLNWCEGMEIVDETTDQVVAKLFIAYGKLNVSFTTRNDMRKNESVSINLVEGPFSQLEGRWTIRSLDAEACKVSLDMDFLFASKVTQKMLGRVFQKIVAAQLDAFQKRAESLYGGVHA